MSPPGFNPNGLGLAGDRLWVADQWRGVLAGVDASTAAVVSIVATMAPVSHTRYTANIDVAGDRLWAATHGGLFNAHRDGSDGSMIDVGGVVGELAVIPDAVWAVVHVPDWGNDLVRVGIDDQRVTRLAVADRIHGLVAGADGVWFVHVATNVMSHVAPDGSGIVDQVQLPGSLYGFGIGDEVVVAVVAVTHPGRKDGRVIGGVLRFDRTSGDMQGVTRRNGLCRALAVHGREAWIQMRSDEHVHPHDGIPLEDQTSVIERVDLDTGAVTDWVTVAEGINQLTGSSSGLWAKGFSRKAQRPWVARIDTGTATTDAEVDFSAVDMSSSPLPPRPPPWRPKDFPEPPERPAPTTHSEVEQRAVVAINEMVHHPLRYDGKGNRMPPGPWIAGFDFEAVRLAGSYPHTRAQFVFRSEYHADCRYGINWPLWDDDGNWNWVWDAHDGLPNPEEEGGRLAWRFEEVLTTGTVLPDRCAPDAEGITWAPTHPCYYGKPRAELTFAETVGVALDRLWPSRRPFTRDTVENLLAHGVDSADDLVRIINSGEDPRTDVALWLLSNLDNDRAANLLVEQITSGDLQARERAVEHLATIARPEQEARLRQLFATEPSPTVRSGLMNIFAIMGDNTSRELAADTVRNESEDPAVRAAAASALGALSIGEPEDIAALTAMTHNPDARLAQAATKAIARCAIASQHVPPPEQPSQTP